MAEVSTRSVQLIAGNGNFNVEGLDHFVRATNLPDRGLHYTVVAIVGPQSSGKSTLMNNLFGTKFKEMDAFKGRSQTTKGIWIEMGAGNEPLVIAMDLEGTDGSKRGEDGTAFEKQSALFALAVADVVLINIWCHDLGREQAASRPLLKTVFQVMRSLFRPRKKTLLFVIRDKTVTPLEILESDLREDIKQIWEAVEAATERQDHKSTPLSEFFNVKVTALPSYEHKEEEFKEQVAELRQLVFDSISPGGLTDDRQGVVPASGFSLSVQQIWKLIKENKDLNLPAITVMVATFRCDEIANEKLRLLLADEGWLALEKDIQVGLVAGFGNKLSSILDTCLSCYDKETIDFDEVVRTKKRQDLESNAISIFHSAYNLMLGHLHSKVFDSFKISLEQLLNQGEGFATAVRTCLQSCLLEFDQGSVVAIREANWDASKVREELHHDIQKHESSVRCAKLSKIKANYKKKLSEALIVRVKFLFEVDCEDTWASIKTLLDRVTEDAASKFSSAIAGFELDTSNRDEMVQNLSSYARTVVEEKAKEEADKLPIHMKDRFFRVFHHDNDMPRVWTRKVDIKTIVKNAKSASLRALSDMAVIRLDEGPNEDKVKKKLFSSLMGGHVEALASSISWEEVSPNDTLKSPMECMLLWNQFKEETKYEIHNVMSSQRARNCCILELCRC